MTTQAVGLVSSIYDIRYEDGVYTLSVDIFVTDPELGSFHFSVYPTSTSVNPLLPNWRQRVANAAEYAALHDYDVELTDIIFGDLNVLGL